MKQFKHTDANRSLTSLLFVKHYNDVLDKQSSGGDREEVTYFYVGDVFVYTLAICMPIFKKKSPLKRLGKSSKLFIVVTLLNTMKSLGGYIYAAVCIFQKA